MNTTNSDIAIDLLQNDLLNCFKTICVPLLYFIQLGFIFIEIGFINKLQNSILIKNILDIIIPSLIWIFVYSLSTNSNTNYGFIGHFYFNSEINLNYLLQLGFLITSLTIVTGALSNRISIILYIYYTIFISLFVYPFITHWIWSDNGFLNKLNFKDFSGASAVHISGGLNSLILLKYFGPRKGFLDQRRYYEFNSKNTFYITSGVFFLWLGWFGFNLSNIKNRGQIINVVFNTTIIPLYTSVFYIIITLMYFIFLKKKIFNSDKIISQLISVFISGLVGSTAFLDEISYNYLYLLSIILSVTYIISNYYIDKIKLDDPVNAVVCHFFPGIISLVFCGIFNKEVGLIYSGNWRFLGIQCLGILIIMIWIIFINIIFLCLYKFNIKYINLHTKLIDQIEIEYTYENQNTDILKDLNIAGILVWEFTKNHRGYKLNSKKSSCFYLSILNYFKASDKYIFPLNEGLIGWVGKQKTEYLYDIDNPSNNFTFDRYDIAKSCNIQYIMVLPICILGDNNEFISKIIVEFLCTKSKVENINSYDLWNYILSDKKIFLDNDSEKDSQHIELDIFDIERISDVLIDTDFSNYNQFILDKNFKIISIDSKNISPELNSFIINKNISHIFTDIDIDELELFLESNNIIKKYNNITCKITDNCVIKMFDINILSNRYSSGEIHYSVYFKITN